MNDRFSAFLRLNIIYMYTLVIVLMIFRGCQPAYAQYTISEMEKVCSEDFNPEQVIECTYTQRVNLGIHTLKQIPYLVELHLWYRDRAEWDDASNITHQMRWLITKNNYRGINDLVETLTWIPDDHTCFEKDGWRYVKWSDGCEDLRYYVVDCFILATGIAEVMEKWEAVQFLAMATSQLSLGVTGESLYIVNREYKYELNMSIPNQYRSDLWLSKSNNARKRL